MAYVAGARSWSVLGTQPAQLVGVGVGGLGKVFVYALTIGSQRRWTVAKCDERSSVREVSGSATRVAEPA